MRNSCGRATAAIVLLGGLLLSPKAKAAPPAVDRPIQRTLIRDIQGASTPASERIVLDMANIAQDKAEFKYARLTNPDRIYLDLVDASLSPEAVAKAKSLSGGPVKRVRLASRDTRNTRIVLDLDGPAEYSVYRMQNPARLVVYVRSASSPPAAAWRLVPVSEETSPQTAALANLKSFGRAAAFPSAHPAAAAAPPALLREPTTFQPMPVAVQPAPVVVQEVASEISASALEEDTDRSPLSVASSAEFSLRPKVPRASIHLRRPDSQSLYKAIADAFGIRILLDKDLSSSRFVSDFQVEDVTLQQALDAAGNISHTFVAPVDELTGIAASDTAEKRGEYERQVLRSFSVDEQSSPQEMTEVVTALQNIVDLRRIAQDPRSNSITVLGRARQVAVAGRFLGTLQKEKGEVIVDIEILEVDRQLARQLGVLSPQPLQLMYLGTGAALTGTPLFLLGGGESLFGIQMPGASAALTFSSSAVRSRQKLQLRASNGQQTSLLIGDRVPVLNGYLSSNALVQTTTGSSTASTSPFVGATPSIEYQDVGVTMKATPYLHSGHELTLKFDLALRAITAESLNGAPIISNRQLTEQIRLHDGETYLVGGIFNQSQMSSLNGYPGLSQIPWLGSLFGIHGKQEADTELLMLIRPHLVRPSPAEEYASNSIYFGKEVVGLPAAPAPPPPQSELPNPAPAPGQQRGVPPGIQPGGVQPGTQPGTQPESQPAAPPGTQQVQPGPRGAPQIFTQPGAPQFPPGFMPGFQPQPAQPQPNQ